MEKIKLGFFDLFGHILPGTFLFLAIILPFNVSFVDFKSIYTFISQFNVALFIVFLLIAYVLSNVLHGVGYLWFIHIGKKIWNSRSKTKGETLLKNKDYSILMTIIRQNSPENYAFIEEWVAKRAMSFNLSLAFVFLAISSIIKLFQTHPSQYSDWVILLILSTISSILMLSKARAYNDWYHDDVYNSIKTIEIDKKIDLSNFYQ